MAVTQDPDAAERIDAWVWRISAVVIVGSVMSILDTTIVNVALATLGRELHSTIAEIQWVVTGYMLSHAAVIPITRWAARRFAAKPVYIVSLVLFTTGSALCGLATSATELIVFRVIQGAGGGMILPIGQLMMADAAGPKRMGRVMSIVAVPAMLAPIFGPTIGGLILDNASWRWIFFVNLPIGVIAVISAMRVLPRVKPEPTGRLDHLGLALMATGLPLISYGLAEIGVTGSFVAAKVVVPCALGVALVAAFARHALRVPQPLLDLRLYRRRTFSSASIAMAAAFASLDRSELAHATPQLNVLQRVGGSIGTAALAVVLQRALTGAHTVAAEASAYGTAFWASAGMTALAIVPCIVLMQAERDARNAGPGREPRGSESDQALSEALAV